MALEVTVGPPVLTINNGYSFLVSELDGSITPASDQGLYSRDTRYLSGYQLYINGASWALLNSGAIAFYASQTYLTKLETYPPSRQSRRRRQPDDPLRAQGFSPGGPILSSCAHRRANCCA